MSTVTSEAFEASEYADEPISCDFASCESDSTHLLIVHGTHGRIREIRPMCQRHAVWYADKAVASFMAPGQAVTVQ